MGKGKRIRARHAAEPEKQEIHARYVERPKAAKERRKRMNAAFREFRALPVPVKRAMQEQAEQLAAEKKEETA